MKRLLFLSVPLFILCFAGSAVGLVWFFYTKSEKAIQIFEICSPEIRDIRQTILVPGTIVPNEEIQIKARIPGIIKEILVHPGDRVLKEQVIAKIEVVPDQLLLNESYNSYSKAHIRFLEAKKTLDRRKLLHANSQAISTEELDKAEYEFQSAKSDLEFAKNNLNYIKQGVGRPDDVTNHTLIRSTIAGTIIEVPVRVGDTIIQSNTFNEGSTIAVVADMTALVFEGDVEEANVGKLKKGMMLGLKIGAVENQRINAILKFISPKGKVETEGQVKFKIRADIETVHGIIIRAGYSANAEIILCQRKEVLSINEASLKFDKYQAPYVELETGNQSFERRGVKLGLSDGIHAEIVEGLSIDDRIKMKSN